MSDQIVYVRSAHSRLHVAVMHDGELLTSEACNFDDMHGERIVESDEALLLPQVERCERCFPPVTIQGGRVTHA